MVRTFISKKERKRKRMKRRLSEDRKINMWFALIALLLFLAFLFYPTRADASPRAKTGTDRSYYHEVVQLERDYRAVAKSGSHLDKLRKVKVICVKSLNLNNEMRKEIKTYMNKYNKLVEDYNKLDKENKKLKAEIERLKGE